MVEMIQDLDQPYDNFSSSSYTAQEEIIELISHVASWAYDLLGKKTQGECSTPFSILFGVL